MFVTRNTPKADMTELLGTDVAEDDIGYVHVRGAPYLIEFAKPANGPIVRGGMRAVGHSAVGTGSGSVPSVVMLR